MRGVLPSLLRHLALACGLSAASLAPVYGGSDLADLRSDVRTSPPPAPRTPPSPDDRDHDGDDLCDDDSWTLDGALGLTCLAGLAVTAPFWGPPALIGDSYAEPGFFAHHPHQYDVGYMLIAPGEASGLSGTRQPWPWAARGRAEYGTDFGDLEWIGGHVLVEHSWRWGAECDVRYVSEDLGPPRRDALWFGDANVLFRLAQSETLQMRTGLGLNFLSDTLGSDFGFNFTYGGDWFPVQPLVFSAELDLGTLGSANVHHLRATAGANWDFAEAYVGYDYYDIGPTQIGGLVAGVRFWY